MVKQVISIGPTGEVSSLRVKPGHGVDLRDLGRVKLERVSEIKLDDGTQLYFVEIISGPLKGQTISTNNWGELFGFPVKWATVGEGSVLLFKEYEDAVKAEVEFLNANRQRGVF